MSLYNLQDLNNFVESFFRVRVRHAWKQIINDCQERIETAPASTRFHGSYPGGWLDHTIEVTQLALSLGKLLPSSYVPSLHEVDSVLFVALSHDLGKLGDPGPDGAPLYLPQPKSDKAAKEPYIMNPDLAVYQHELRSLHWLNYYQIECKEAELIAIAHHAGAYNATWQTLGDDAKHPLMILLHSADNLIAKVKRI